MTCAPSDTNKQIPNLLPRLQPSLTFQGKNITTHNQFTSSTELAACQKLLAWSGLCGKTRARCTTAALSQTVNCDGLASAAGGGGRSGADPRPRAPSSSQGVTETAPDLAATTSASHAPLRHWSPGSPERCPRRHTGMPASISTQGTQIINRSLQNESLGKGTHSGTEKPEGWTSADKSRASEHHCLHRARPPLPILPDTVMDNCHQLSSGIVSDCPS